MFTSNGERDTDESFRKSCGYRIDNVAKRAVQSEKTKWTASQEEDSVKESEQEYLFLFIRVFFNDFIIYLFF